MSSEELLILRAQIISLQSDILELRKELREHKKPASTWNNFSFSPVTTPTFPAIANPDGSTPLFFSFPKEGGPKKV